MENEYITEIRSLMSETKDWNKIWLKLSPEAREQFSKILQEKKIKDSVDIIKLFNENKLDYVVLKGISLQQLNKQRRFDDLDIFIARKDLEKASELLKALNYKANEDELQKFNKNKGFHIGFEQQGRIPVELHYFLLDCSYFDENVLPTLSDKIFLDINGVKIPCLSKEMQLIEIILHNLYNHGFIVDYKRWFDDIKSITNNYNMEWNKFLSLIDAMDANEIVYRAIKLLELFNNNTLGLPDNVIEQIYRRCSKIRLWLTRIFDREFYERYSKIKNETESSERFRLDWKLKYSLRFSAGLSKHFLKLLWFYVWTFKLKIPEIIPYTKNKIKISVN